MVVLGLKLREIMYKRCPDIVPRDEGLEQHCVSVAESGPDGSIDFVI